MSGKKKHLDDCVEFSILNRVFLEFSNKVTLTTYLRFLFKKLIGKLSVIITKSNGCTTDYCTFILKSSCIGSKCNEISFNLFVLF